MSTLVRPTVKNTLTGETVVAGFLYNITSGNPPRELEIKSGKTVSKIESGKTYYMFYSSVKLGVDYVSIREDYLQKVFISDPKTRTDNCEIYITLLPVIYLKFEVYNKKNNNYDPLPSGIDVLLMNDRFVDQEILKEQTDSNGLVTFNLNSIARVIKEKPDLDIFFIVRTKKKRVADVTLPDQWSSFKWKTKDGKPGYYRNHSLLKDLGSDSAPLTYRIGVDVHLKLQYQNNRVVFVDALEKIPVVIHKTDFFDTTLIKGNLDASAEFHDLIIDVEADQSIFLRVFFELEDSAINMGKARVITQLYSPSFSMSVPAYFWLTKCPDDDKWIFKLDGKTSVGTKTSPEIIKCSHQRRHNSLYVLKNYRELSIYLYSITAHAWSGFKRLEYKPGLGSYAWPVGTVNLHSSDFFNRHTIIHETAHQIMWQELNISSVKIAYEASPLGELKMSHYLRSIFNPEHALIEGWAEFFEAIFGDTFTITNVYKGTDTSTSYPLHSLAINTGESVEGAVALGLWNIYKNFVVGKVTADPGIPETIDGDVSINNSWINNPGVIANFMKIIWQPFLSLASKSDPTSTDYFEAIRTANSLEWHKMVVHLNNLNMYLRTPKITAITPPLGAKAGGQTVTITGDEFVDGQMEVYFGSKKGTHVNVINSGSLTVQTPASTSAGGVSVKVLVKTPVTTFATNYTTKADGYTYK